MGSIVFNNHQNQAMGLRRAATCVAASVEVEIQRNSYRTGAAHERHPRPIGYVFGSKGC